MRENRTYDQVFGSDPRGDGAPQLELFDDNGVGGPTGGITPNAHALTQQFPLLDHFYADSEVSVDGHLITTGGYATDYVQKALAANYSTATAAFDFGIYPVRSRRTTSSSTRPSSRASRSATTARRWATIADHATRPTGRTYSGVAANTDPSTRTTSSSAACRPA